ncbi:MAG: hypothetical protein IPL23_03000 [Saprospiraceae bacterium]|nr:hypothetical protein [Saprospiraceae bacterium]
MRQGKMKVKAFNKRKCKTSVWLLLVFFLAQHLYSQEKDRGYLTGSLDVNANVFIKDSSINAFGLPQYERQFFGGESWLNLQYNIGTLTAGIRYDMFINSNLRNPNDSYSGQGIGRWYMKKSFDKLDIQAGYIYDQIGSGIIYRSYETRPLFIDNSLLGASVNYKFSDRFNIKGFAGKQKDAFDIYQGTIKGLNSELYNSFGEENPLTLLTGIGFIHKTISDDAMERVVNSLKSYLPVDRFGPVYNSYAYSLYNTLSYKAVTWYLEGALKSRDIFYNPDAPKLEPNGASTFGKYEFKRGSVLYSSLSFSLGNLSMTLEGKRTENFNFRIDPNLRLLRGYISYIPPMNRQNTYRLPARYAPFTQELSEQAFQIDAKYRWSKKFQTNLNVSAINTLKNVKLYREIYFENTFKPNTNWNFTFGLQNVQYNQNIYEQKPDAGIVKTIVPFTDILYKISNKKSIRWEAQYMSTQQDFGSWLYSLIEVGLAPSWIFETSIMYNVDPKRTLVGAIKPEKILYPTLGVTYSKDVNRLQLKYVKQVEGIVCSGGICRLEPAFSGVRFTLSSQL